jgi:hypothetical protein
VPAALAAWYFSLHMWRTSCAELTAGSSKPKTAEAMAKPVSTKERRTNMGILLGTVRDFFITLRLELVR